MDNNFERSYFKWMSWIFFAFTIVGMYMAIDNASSTSRRLLVAFAACMFIATLVSMSIIKEMAIRRITAEDGEKARQSEERKHKIEIERSEREAERIRAAEANKVVVNITHGE